MTADERAEKVMGYIGLDENTWDIDKKVIAIAIQEAENDVIEKAAIMAEHATQFPINTPTAIALANRIRSLKQQGN